MSPEQVTRANALYDRQRAIDALLVVMDLHATPSIAIRNKGTVEIPVDHEDMRDVLEALWEKHNAELTAMGCEPHISKRAAALTAMRGETTDA